MIDWSVIADRLRWQDVADVAFLTLIGYRVYAWLRGTVALQILGGMGVLLVGAYGASRAGLVLTGFVLQAVGAVAAVAAVVVFQDELRRALRGADPVAWWRRRRAAGGPTPAAGYANLARGLLNLAHKRLGALVVLPRFDDLGEHLTAGTPIDGRVSPELLESIFVTSSPIHDGASVVRGGRIERAGAFLPLSTSSTLPESFGTRHRAAAGLSECCDAVVAVVSEERGTIMLAVDGRLVLAPSVPEALASQLERAVKTPAGAPAARMATAAMDRVHDERRRRWLNALALLVILASVTGAWYALAGDRSTLISQNLPIELRGVPEGMEVSVVQPESGEAIVRMRGPRQLLYSQARDDVAAWVLLKGLGPGRHQLVIESSAPPGLEVMGTDPREVVVRVVTAASR